MHSLRAPRFFALPVALACLLTACGGGGGGSSAVSVAGNVVQADRKSVV